MSRMVAKYSNFCYTIEKMNIQPSIKTLRSRMMRHVAVVLPAVVVLFVVVSTGALLYVRSRMVMEEELRERLRSAAAISAVHFDGDNIRDIRSPSSMDTALFRDIVYRLNIIRESVPNVQYAYIMRRTSDPYTLEFVADADSLTPESELDVNGNGVVDPDEEISIPGDTYDITDVPVMQDQAFSQPAVDEEITYDQWGALISGYAPIRDNSNEVVAILGLDMDATDYLQLSQSIFSPFAFALLFFTAILMAGYIMLFYRERYYENMQKMNDERAALVDLASHQLGAPLAIFRWWVEIMKDQQKSICDDSEICLQMDEGIKRMESIIKDMRKANNIQKGEVAYTPQKESLKNIIDSVAAQTALKMKETSKELIVDIKEDISMNIDKQLIEGVLLEIVENAIHYSPAQTKITIHAERKPRFVQIEVRDQGYGVPKEELPHMFEEFRRGSNAERYKPVGNGVGLFVAKGIVEHAGGSIWMESEAGRGTTVFMRLPL